MARDLKILERYLNVGIKALKWQDQVTVKVEGTFEGEDLTVTLKGTGIYIYPDTREGKEGWVIETVVERGGSRMDPPDADNVELGWATVDWMAAQTALNKYVEIVLAGAMEDEGMAIMYEQEEASRKEFGEE